MTRREWERSTDPAAMLDSVSFPLDALPQAHQSALFRRLRVFTLTAAQAVLDRVNHPACHAIARVGWRLAEGMASDDELRAVEEQLRAAWEEGMGVANHHFDSPPGVWALPRLVNVLALLFREPDGPHGAARHLVVPISFVHPGEPVPLLTPDEVRGCCVLIREVFGDRGAMNIAYGWERDWCTSAVVAIAQQMYESGDFSAMPILADALQDAGCENKDILGHCRGSGPHIRGCWLVDMVLGKL